MNSAGRESKAQELTDKLTKMKFASQGQAVEAEQVQEEGETFLKEQVGAQNKHQGPMSQRRINMKEGRAWRPDPALAKGNAHLKRLKVLLNIPSLRSRQTGLILEKLSGRKGGMPLEARLGAP